MDATQVKALVADHLEDCEVSVDGQGNAYNVLVVGELFDGMRPVQRQQAVYAALKEVIADGSVHAVNIRALTPAQWQNEQ